MDIRRKSNGASRSIAMLLGGLTAGIIGSRVVPPLVAAALRSRRVRAGEDPFALLIQDHRQIEHLLDQMAAAGPESTMRRSGLFLMLKRKLAKHALAEEDVVYPIVHNRSGESERPKHLYDEHADMKILLYELESRVKSRTDWSSQVTRLRDLVRRHVEEEETQVFPQLREQLGRDSLPRVSGQISREEALIV